jgi:hypothetical protein
MSKRKGRKGEEEKGREGEGEIILAPPPPCSPAPFLPFILQEVFRE